jgi:hypothetical protein
VLPGVLRALPDDQCQLFEHQKMQKMSSYRHSLNNSSITSIPSLYENVNFL